VLVAVAFHHILGDGRSLLLMEEDLVRDLSAEVAPPRPAAVQFTDYATWERRWLDGAGAPLLDYWRRWVAEAEPLRGPDDQPLQWRQGVKVYYECDLGAGVVQGLRSLAAERSSTPFLLLLSALSLAVARWSGQSRFVMRSVGDLRTSRTLSAMVGNLVCTDLLEIDTTAGEFADVVRRTGAEYMNATRLRCPNLLGLPGAGDFPDPSPDGVAAKTAVTINYLPIYAFLEPPAGPADDGARPVLRKGAKQEFWRTPICPIYLRIWDWGPRHSLLFEFVEELVDETRQRQLMDLFIDIVWEITDERR
jgi:hypothetical protein